MIIFKDICKKYGDLIVFNNFNLELNKGKTTCFMGQSGKGKTTLIRLLMGLETADSGKITGIKNAKFSAVFQEDRLCENLDVYANIMLPHLYKNSNTPITKQKIDSALKAIGLENCGKQFVNTLSGGMKRRVAILRALFADYDILLLDEPFKGLDDETKKSTMLFLQSEIKHKTVIYITHDKSELEFMAPDAIVNLAPVNN